MGLTVDTAHNAAPMSCVLVVEDDVLLRQIVSKLLKRWGYRTLEASDGGSALDRVRESSPSPDLMLLDIMLPEINGVEVARIVRVERPDLPIVACSAAFDAEVEADLMALGVESLLPKPFSADALRAVLESAIPSA